jgi:hypothetical protein
VKPVLFLDIDGVLVPYPGVDHPLLHPRLDMQTFNPYCVTWLNRILRVLDADIVITSAWRNGRTLPELQELFALQGVEGMVVGKTASLSSRYVEIMDWLERNHLTGFPHLILDDEWDSRDPLPWELVMVHDRYIGLSAGTFNSAVTRWMVLRHP